MGKGRSGSIGGGHNGKSGHGGGGGGGHNKKRRNSAPQLSGPPKNQAHNNNAPKAHIPSSVLLYRMNSFYSVAYMSAFGEVEEGSPYSMMRPTPAYEDIFCKGSEQAVKDIMNEGRKPITAVVQDEKEVSASHKPVSALDEVHTQEPAPVKLIMSEGREPITAVVEDEEEVSASHKPVSALEEVHSQEPVLVELTVVDVPSEPDNEPIVTSEAAVMKAVTESKHGEHVDVQGDVKSDVYIPRGDTAAFEHSEASKGERSALLPQPAPTQTKRTYAQIIQKVVAVEKLRGPPPPALRSTAGGAKWRPRKVVNPLRSSTQVDGSVTRVAMVVSGVASSTIATDKRVTRSDIDQPRTPTCSTQIDEYVKDVAMASVVAPTAVSASNRITRPSSRRVLALVMTALLMAVLLLLLYGC